MTDAKLTCMQGRERPAEAPFFPLLIEIEEEAG